MTEQRAEKPEQAFVDTFDFEELMRHCFGIDENEDVGEFLELRSQADGAFELCHDIVRVLLPMAHIATSSLTQKKYQAFCKTEGGCLVAIVKRNAA